MYAVKVAIINGRELLGCLCFRQMFGAGGI